MPPDFDRPLPAVVEHVNGTLRPSVVSVVVEPGPQRVVARVRGEIDMENADGLRRDLTAALEGSIRGLDIDLSAVTFCDSQGVHVLGDLNRLAHKAGKTLVLTALSRPVARLLRATGAQYVFIVRGWPPPKDLTTGGDPEPGP
ncbi:STAS domain-containing protein [Streptomyces roseicoloratus]|uniref:STAS domain-containing protein n=1 Tax=Streptomyces roseicoloratus TaxID=2508722 RepID=A0ABY9RN51_9ACTN|nr:STAS domain-containing protein [Streptomyces roseicoloratus]WMX43615.1 STAS domain-containing protein [Streptomyces roseicoloratus]